jgi:hypothetical protein
MELYVCYGTFKSRKPGGHPCRNAYEALTAAGHRPEIVRTYGCVANAAFKGRRKVKRLTGTSDVPILVLDDGTVVDGTASIVEWAGREPTQAPVAGSASAPA